MWYRLTVVATVSLLAACTVSCGSSEGAEPLLPNSTVDGAAAPSASRRVESAGGRDSAFQTQDRWTFADAREARASGEIVSGETVRFVPGVVTAADETHAFVQEHATQSPAAVFVQLGGIEVQAGELLELEGPVTERFGVFTLQLERVQRLGTTALPTPIALNLPTEAELERHESLLVTFKDVKVTSLNPDAPREFGEFQVSGELRVDDLFFDGDGGLAIGTGLSITAPLYFSFGAFKLVPRSAADLVRTPVGCGDNCNDPCQDRDDDNDGFNACVDCDDSQSTVFPGAPELCDGLDNNCDGSVRFETDTDGDQLLDCTRCDTLGFFQPALAASSPSGLVSALRSRSTFDRCSYDDSRDDLFEFVDEGTIETLYIGRVENNIDSWDDARREDINVEHSWPQSQGSSGKARCDIHHLFPSDEMANGRRGNYPLGLVVDVEWSQGGSRFGENGDGQRVFEPREPVRGDLARALTYWLLHYRGQSSNSFIEAQIDFFRAWNKADPVTAAERQRDERIEAVQSNHNPFVACPFFVDSALDVLEP